MSIASDRTIVLSPLVNLRDIGGIAVRGGVVRGGVLLRSDDVSTITAEQAAELIAGGLGTVIDLRSPGEAAYTGRGPLGEHDVAYHHLPLTSELSVPGTLAVKDGSPQSVGRWYADLVIERASTLDQGMRIVADAPAAVLFHCAAGKDRTGIFAACILSVLGATPVDIAADYAVTDAAMPAILERLRPIMAGILGGRYPDGGPTGALPTMDALPAMGALLAAPAASMEAMLDRLAEEPGGTPGILERAGLDQQVVDALERKLVVALDRELVDA